MKLNLDQLIKWQYILNSYGPRLTGTDSHNRFIRFLQTEVSKLGYPIKRAPFNFNRTTIDNSQLTMTSNHTPIQLSGPVPYSGITGPEGITAPLKFCHKIITDKVRGKIAVINVRNLTIPSWPLMQQIDSFPQHKHKPGLLRHPLVSSTLIINTILKAKNKGAKGVLLIWHNISEELAVNEILPFTNDYLGIPAVWVHEKQQPLLEKTCHANKTVTLTINGHAKEEVTTESFSTMIKGTESKNQTIIINTHTDGPNAIEDNGPIALLTMLKYIKDQKMNFRHTFIFCFVSGHFQISQAGIHGGQATSRWLKDSRQYWDGHSTHGKAVLGITVEHLGVDSYTDNPRQNRLIYQNMSDSMYVYVSNQRNLSILNEAMKVTQPLGNYYMLKCLKTAYFGEGQPLFQNGIPTISFICMPLTLCQLASFRNEPNIRLMFNQINLIMQLLTLSDRRL
ncbi:zinc-binding metallopeptidase family protein [Lentilactobacillus hilgardii]|uniref:hypothetical protein n=2 Tax=Lentilactobacillus hilgardii TaxID=1588 RepID=UPI0021C47470|nr:hypothetical protein [Lentilactobacillus hilgardii]MCP9333759.1 hypothetical protein [Lentilactobacillus hilgardii]MCP9350349.1 hypothetical protein [Lentilactobacillus hilgardii]MCP9353243.1 hypothetical protein [Lentilactobacillus hilgardii]